MKVILQDNVVNLGRVGEIVKVRDGYGRNFLIPRGLAEVADERNVRQLEHLKRQASAKASKLMAEAKAQAGKLSETSVTMRRKVGEENRIFGSVTPRDIAEALNGEGFSVDRRHITMSEQVKTLGVFSAEVELATDVKATVKVFVIAET